MNLLSSAAQYSLSTILLRLLPFLLIPLYTRSLSIDDYGRLVTLLSIVQLLSLVMDCGARTSLMTYFRPDADVNARAEVMGTVLVINLAAALGVTIVSLPILVTALPKVLGCTSALNYALLACMVAYLQSLNTVLVSYYRIINAPRLFALTAVPTAFLNFLLIASALLALKAGIVGALAASCASYGVMSSIVLAGTLRSLGFGYSASLARAFFRFGSPLVLSSAGEMLADSAPIFFLASLGNLNGVSLYGIASKLSTVPLTLLVLPFTMAYEPYVVLQAAQNDINRRIADAISATLLCFAFIALALTIASPALIAFMAPPAYASASSLLSVMLLGMAFRTVYYASEPLLHVKHQTLLKGLSVLAGVAVFACLYPIVIPRWGAAGAAWVYALTIASYSLPLAAVARSAWGISLRTRRFAIAAAMCALFLAGAAALPTRPQVARSLWGALGGLLGIYVVNRARFFTDTEYAALGALMRRYRSALPAWSK